MIKKTQREKVLEHMQTGKPLSGLTCLKIGGGIRLSAIIYDLKKEGYVFTDEWVIKEDVKYKEYTLKGKI